VNLNDLSDSDKINKINEITKTNEMTETEKKPSRKVYSSAKPKTTDKKDFDCRD
jgi:hypothetical protein